MRHSDKALYSSKLHTVNDSHRLIRRLQNPEREVYEQLKFRQAINGNRFD